MGLAIKPTGILLAVVTLALALISALLSAPALAAEGPLSRSDAALYRQAFSAADKGDFKTAESALDKVKDTSLVGHVALVKLMHPTAYKASYADLTAWLKSHADLGGAERVYALAQKRQPPKTPEPRAPTFLAAIRDWTSSSQPVSGDRSFAARDAYYSGEVSRAWALGPSSGEPWIAGLAGWRLGKVDEARRFFLQVASDESLDDWTRAAGWFWAGRCAERLGQTATALDDFGRAAAMPHTFYGLIASRKSSAVQDGPRAERAQTLRSDAPLLVRVSERDERRSIGLLEREPRAQRAAALTQIDRPVEAAQELRVGLALARSETAQREWQALIVTLRTPLQVAAPAAPVSKRAKARPYRPETYETPELYPDGGFTLDRALIYALVRQESRFNPYAYSAAGAIGLMQVRPESAARAAGDDQLLKSIMPLFDPPTNLRVGQDYMHWLIERGLGGGDEAFDLFRVIAAYNAGAGAVLKTRSRLEPDADALLFIESLPARETRDYVEKVAFGYWTYRSQFGQPAATLDAAARYARLVDMRADR